MDCHEIAENIFVFDMPRTIKHGTHEERVEFEDWLRDNFETNAFIIAGDVWIIGGDLATLFKISWAGY